MSLIDIALSNTKLGKGKSPLALHVHGKDGEAVGRVVFSKRWVKVFAAHSKKPVACLSYEAFFAALIP